MALKYKFNPFTGKLDLIDEAGAAGGGNAYFTKVVAASDSIGTPTADYTCDGTDDEVQINQAITDLGATGGTVMLLDGTFNLGATITMASNVNLRGNGWGTVITVADAEASKFNFITCDTINNFKLLDFKIDGKDGIIPVDPDTMIELDTATEFEINGVYIHRPDEAGIRCSDNTKDFVITNCLFETCANWSIRLATFIDSYGKIVNNTIKDGGTYGIRATSNTHSMIISGNSFEGCSSMSIESSSGSRGWEVVGNTIEDAGVTSAGDFMNVNNNFLYNISFAGITMNGQQNNCNNNMLRKCGSSNDKAIRLFFANATNCIGNNIQRDGGGTNYAIAIESSTECNIQGNNLEGGWDTAAFFRSSESRNIVKNNFGSDTNDEMDVRRMKNVSGSALAIGDVVVLNASAAGDEVTTTTSQGDDLVFGVAAEAINNNAYGFITTLGKIETLSADGTTAIAVGDFLGTYTSAGVVQKAASGDMAIAIALEALAAGSGTLDALIINPRKI